MSIERTLTQPDEASREAQLVNQFVWHGAQSFYKPFPRPDVYAVQPQLIYGETLDDPIDIVIHPDHTFPRESVWAVNHIRSIYTLLRDFRHCQALETAVQVAEIEASPEVRRAMGGVSMTPTVILSLRSNTELLLGRPDLDDAERRYLSETRYLFWQDKPPRRQDTYSLGDEESFVVTARPSLTELQRLHDSVYQSDNACEIGVKLDHYAPISRLPREKIVRLFSK